MLSSLSLLIVILYCPTRAADLTLPDGTVLIDYKLLSHDQDSVTLRHKGGAKKLSKELLGTDALSALGINDVRSEHDKVMDGVPKDQRAAVSAAIRNASESSVETAGDLLFEGRVKVDEERGVLLVLTREYLKAGKREYGAKYTMAVISEAAIPDAIRALERYLIWDAEAQKQNIPYVSRTLGKIDGFDWQFERSEQGIATLRMRGFTWWEAEEVKATIRLLAKVPSMKETLFAKIEASKRGALLP